MLPLLADENFNGHIISGLRRRLNTIDIRTAVEAGLSGQSDSRVLATGAAMQRVLLTHDRRTIPAFAMERVQRGETMSGVILVPLHLPVGAAIDEILLIAECSVPADWDGQIRTLPL